MTMQRLRIVSEDELSAARDAWPAMTDQQLRVAVVAAEEHVVNVAKERLRLREIYREARRRRVEAGKGDWTDLTDETDVVCPDCGHFQTGKDLTKYRVEWAPGVKGVACDHCQATFGVRVEVQRSFTTFKL